MAISMTGMPVAKVVNAMAISQSSLSPIELAARTQNKVFILYVIVLVIGGLLTAGLTVWLWKATNRYQEAVKGDADARIEDAKSVAATANDSAKKLEHENLVLRTDLSTATGQVAALQRDAARQQERAALAEGALLELQERLAHRRISPAQHDILVARLLPYKGSVVQVTKLGDSEAAQFADDILAVLRDAGWTVNVNMVGAMSPPPYGLRCLVDEGSPPGQSLAAVLRELPTADIQTARHRQVVGEVLVGLRPPP